MNAVQPRAPHASDAKTPAVASASVARLSAIGGRPAWPRAVLLMLAVAGFLGWRFTQRPTISPPVMSRDAGAGPQSAQRTSPGLPTDDLALTTPAMLDAAADADPDRSDARLLRIWASVASGHVDQALTDVRRLVSDTPNFALAQLTYADLLRMRDGHPPVSGFGATTSDVPPGVRERLDELLSEARVRIGAAAVPPAGTLPTQFVQLAPQVRHAIAVDVAKSRVYVLANTRGGWSVERNFYASIGKLGYTKRAEGDMRTPLGLYFVTGTVAKGRLADRFGAAALTLNYPNQYDQLRGRTGMGIWLHGVPTALFARAPLATDGCVALENTDLLALSRFIDRQTTPILIAPHLEWVAPERAETDQHEFLTTFAAWKSAHLHGRVDDELPFFSAETRTPALATAPPWSTLLQQTRSASAPWEPSMDDVSIIGWQDDDALMVVTFHERASPIAAVHLMRQYWLHHGSDWKIIYEGSLE